MEGARVICLGDSLTTGYGLGPGHSFVRLVDRAAAPEWVGRGIPGDTAAGVLARLVPDALSEGPRGVFFLCGTNDVLLTGEWGQIRPAVMALCHQTAASGAIPVIGIPYLFRAIPAEWKGICPPVEALREAMRGYIAWLRSFAETTGIRHVDFARAFESAAESRPEVDLLQADGLHPNEEGVRLMADTVLAAPSLRALLRAKEG